MLHSLRGASRWRGQAVKKWAERRGSSHGGTSDAATRLIIIAAPSARSGRARSMPALRRGRRFVAVIGRARNGDGYTRRGKGKEDAFELGDARTNNERQRSERRQHNKRVMPWINGQDRAKGGRRGPKPVGSTGVGFDLPVWCCPCVAS